jgi:hypothetical protein
LDDAKSIVLQDEFQDRVSQGTEVSHGEVPFPDRLETFMGRDFRETPGEEKAEPPFDIQIIGKGDKEFPSLLQHSMKFTDGIKRILRMFDPVETDEVIKRMVSVRKGTVEITDIELELRNRKIRGIDITTGDVESDLS